MTKLTICCFVLFLFSMADGQTNSSLSRLPSQPVIIHDWQGLENDLEATAKLNNADGLDAIKDNALFKQIQASHNRQLFLEMTTQRDYPFVPLAGFYCLKEQFPKQALLPAMHIILAVNPNLLMLDGDIVIYLQGQKNSKELRSAFCSLANEWGTNTSNLFILTGLFSNDFLYQWFHSEENSVTSLTFDAAVLDRLFGEASTNHRPISKKMTAVIERMKDAPGLPRLEYVFWTSAEKAAIMPYLKAYLEDKSLSYSDIRVLVWRRKDYVQELLSGPIDIPPERRANIEKTIKFIDSKKFTNSEKPMDHQKQ